MRRARRCFSNSKASGRPASSISTASPSGAARTASWRSASTSRTCVKPAGNVLAVRIDNRLGVCRESPRARHSSGTSTNFNANYGGIPKNVRLHVTDKLYQTLPLYSNLGTTGVYVYAQDFDIKGRSAKITAETAGEQRTCRADEHSATKSPSPTRMARSCRRSRRRADPRRGRNQSGQRERHGRQRSATSGAGATAISTTWPRRSRSMASPSIPSRRAPVSARRSSARAW